MKPIYLAMNYFGPHEHSVIDFSKLEEAPIFLIGGDTGAGKSTIFDAMTFALFGSTTNDGPEGRAAKEMRSQFAPDDQPTTVTFYFEQGNHLYKIERTPEQWLTKKTGKGLTKRPTTAKLAIVDAVNGAETDSIAAKPVDVGHEIAGILNLSADQFKKIILLPQNDFSEFLKSKTSEKETILKKIFGTQLYSNFTEALKERYTTASKKGQVFDTKLNAELHSTKWTDEEKDQLDHEAADQRLGLVKHFVAQRKATLVAKTAVLTKCRQTTQTAFDKLQSAKDIQTKFTNLANFKRDYQTKIVDQAAAIAKDQKHVAELTWADTLKDPIRDLETKTSELTQITTNQAELTKQATAAKTRYDTAQAQVTALADQKDDFNAKDHRVQILTTLIPNVERFETLQEKMTVLQPKVTQLEQASTDQTKAAEKIATEIAAKNQLLLQPIDQLQQRKDALTHDKSHFIDTLTPLENAHLNAAKEVTTAEEALTKLKRQVATKQATELAAKQVFDQKISERQKWMIAQLQTELQDDQPCVVCGSTDHSHMVPVADASETELKASMAAVDQAQDAYASAKKDTETTHKQIEEATEQLTAKTATAQHLAENLAATYAELSTTSTVKLPADFSMAAIRKCFDQALTTVNADLTTANQLVANIQKLEQQRQQVNEAVTTIKLQLSTQKTEYLTAQKEAQKLSQQIDTTVPSTNLKHQKKQLAEQFATYQEQTKQAQANVQHNQLDWSKTQTKLDDTTNRLKTAQQQVDTLTHRIAQALQRDDAQTNDRSVLEAWMAELSQQVLSQLQVKIGNYQQEKRRLEKEIDQLTTKLADTEQPDVAAMQAVYDKQKDAADDALAAMTVADTKLKDAQESFSAIEAIVKEQGAFAKQFSELTGLYNIVTGKDGNDQKLKLETYVVQSYLQRVLNYANNHFINLLSNNRYTFELADEVTDKRTDHGLDINVFDNETGEARPSGTLSGGETFIAALSIALSLSEVVQSSSNGVQIDALFVDEGFGSLDDETLTKAMQALETIGQNRMVGVISHIDSMKQAIGQQLMVKKLGDGRSKIELISK